MAKISVYSVSGKVVGDMDMPKQFNEPVRSDLIKRAVLAQQSHKFQQYGADPRAGTRQGEATPKRRKKYRTTYGYGISRIKRKIAWRRGLRFGWVGAFVANAIGGRKAFPPQANKVLAEKINTKERRKAIRSAIAATIFKDFVEARNHQIADLKDRRLIIVYEDKFEDLKKSKDVKAALIAIGLGKELERASKKKVRAGRGTMRGRRYKKKIGPLIVVSKKCDAIKAARNLPGVDVITVESLNAELLAPGTVPGRLTVWTKNAMHRLSKEGLFE